LYLHCGSQYFRQRKRDSDVFMPAERLESHTI
jgi:hypothetical protein